MTEIPLTRGYAAMIDDEDTELVDPHHWRALTHAAGFATLVPRSVSPAAGHWSAVRLT